MNQKHLPTTSDKPTSPPYSSHWWSNNMASTWQTTEAQPTTKSRKLRMDIKDSVGDSITYVET